MSIVPNKNYRSAVSSTSSHHKTSNAAPALPDSLRNQNGGATPLSTQTNGKHPLETKLQSWDQTQRNRDLEQYRRVFGLAEPMKREMELAIVQNSDFNPLSQSTDSGFSTSLHRDILLNREASVDWEDVYQGSGIVGGVSMGPDVHGAIEKSLGI
ncbi:LANO_0E07822g1_1 [Lachancea nothofagi CBS 11611]|uniref:LANO_0E07822g1_1 n=1 Tax=Lachancea nothofagi CBS 11611 TaxID=1266666 RepID=A0A1G4JUR8_9SACH|nr:LANO_0E07822g1_1 [Lachancea nothofagi CBS 11611]